MLSGDEKLYVVRYKGINYYVQATCIDDAISVWEEEVAEKNGWNGQEPEQVTWIHGGPVIMRTPPATP